MLLHRSGTPGSERVCGSRDGLGVGVGRHSQVGVLAFRIEARAGLGHFREVPVALDDRALVLRLVAAKELLEGVLLLWCAGVLREIGRASCRDRVWRSVKISVMAGLEQTK